MTEGLYIRRSCYAYKLQALFLEIGRQFIEVLKSVNIGVFQVIANDPLNVTLERSVTVANNTVETILNTINNIEATANTGFVNVHHKRI